jgi:hypothetical protein
MHLTQRSCPVTMPRNHMYFPETTQRVPTLSTLAVFQKLPRQHCPLSALFLLLEILLYLGNSMDLLQHLTYWRVLCDYLQMLHMFLPT